MTRHLRILALVVALGAGNACVVRGRGIYTVDFAPPPPRAALVLAPRPGHVWIEGNWQWEHGHWVWHDGYWVRERAGEVWIAGAWLQIGARWQWHPGRWERRDRHDAKPRPQARDHRSPTPAPPPPLPPPQRPPGRDHR